MIYQRFGQGVSNLSTVAELRTFDGTDETQIYFPVERIGHNFPRRKKTSQTDFTLHKFFF